MKVEQFFSWLPWICILLLSLNSIIMEIKIKDLKTEVYILKEIFKAKE